MLHRKTILLFAGLFALIVWAGCDREQKTAPDTSTAPRTVEDRFAIRVGERIVSMQLAALPDEMRQGLMFRKSMGEDEGMLFIYERPQQMNFWMRNTEIPLNIGFFDANGELKETYEMYPRDEKTRSSRGRALLYALEMNQGWFARNGVKAGAKLDLHAVAEALKARGLKPEERDLK